MHVCVCVCVCADFRTFWCLHSSFGLTVCVCVCVRVCVCVCVCVCNLCQSDYPSLWEELGGAVAEGRFVPVGGAMTHTHTYAHTRPLHVGNLAVNKKSICVCVCVCAGTWVEMDTNLVR